MNIPKDVPGDSVPGTQKQEPASNASEAERIPEVSLEPEAVVRSESAQTSGHFPLQPKMSFKPQITVTETPAVQNEEKASGIVGSQAFDGSKAEDPDPMKRLEEIVSRSPQELAGPVAMPELVAVPQIEIAAEDRPAAPSQPAVSTKRRQFFLFRRKQKDLQSNLPVTAEAVAEEPEEIPVKKGLWGLIGNRRKRERAEAVRHRRVGRDKRWARRRRRVWLEELLGWIFVPIILIGIYWAALGMLTLLGTTPEAMMTGIKVILSHF